MMPFECALSTSCMVKTYGWQTFVAFLRYYPVAFLAFGLFWVWKKGYFQKARIQDKFPKLDRLWNETKWSALTLFIFPAMATWSVYNGKAGFSAIYLDMNKYGTFYLFASFFILMAIHETYFYWAHRAMHSKKLFKYVHRVHHMSNNPSPLAAYSFHPLEAILEGIWLPLTVLFLPLHPIVIFTYANYAMFMNIWWHLGYEFLPKGFTRGKITGLFSTSTHHNMHHSHVNCNYSLYWNVWDRIMGTNHPAYHDYFDAVADKRAAAKKSPEPEGERALAGSHT